MSKLLQEVVIEAKKLREYAIAEAKNSVMESLTPAIKEMAEKEINKVLESPLFEEEVLDEVDAALAANATPPTETPVDPNAVPPTDPMAPPAVDPSLDPAMAAEPKTIQISEPTLVVPVPAPAVEEMPSTEMPVDPNAGLTPPIQAQTPPVAPALTETDEENEELEQKMSLDEETYEVFKESISYLERVSESRYVNKQMIKPRLVKLFVMLENNKTKWNLTKSVAALAENRINVIFEELDKKQNSYNENKGTDMKTIREFTQSLFTESKEGFGDGGEAKTTLRSDSEVNKASAKSAEHAKALVKPATDPGKADSHKLEGTPVKGTGKADAGPQEKGKALTEAEEMDEAEKALMEMLDAELDGGKEEVVSEGSVDETVSAEQVVAEAKNLQRKLLKEKIKRALKECMMGDEHEGDMGGMAPAADAEMAPELDMGSAKQSDLDGDGDMDLWVNVNMPDGEEEGLEVEEEPELDMTAAKKHGEEETVLEVVDDMSDLQEADQLIKENRQLKSRLNESDLLTARSIYLNKILTEHNLSTRQKQAVVRHLDKSRNLAEAKDCYFKISSLLRDKNKVVASPSAVTKPAQTSLNESAATRPGFSVGSVERWQQLAGIKK